MIRKVRLRNFKCFREIDLQFAPMTILTGVNGMGKSSVIQALLLLRQSYDLGLLKTNGLVLNGNLIKLGSGLDVLFLNAKEDSISFGIETVDNVSNEWEFKLEPGSDLLPIFSNLNNEEIYQLNLFHYFQYLQAERTGPRNSFQMNDFMVLRNRQMGTRGEYCAHFLAAYERDDIEIPQLSHPNALSTGLRDQVEAWIGSVSPGIRIHVTTYPSMDLVNLQFSIVSGSYVSDPYRAANVGFGLTYSLPMVVATLALRPGGLLIVENPEAHLHPKAQTHMTELFARAAAQGAQILVETHSDHVLNGVRLAAHKGILSPEKIKIHFFERGDKDMEAEVISPIIDRNGRIDYWPKDFFDEWDKSLDQLLG